MQHLLIRAEVAKLDHVWVWEFLMVNSELIMVNG